MITDILLQGVFVGAGWGLVAVAFGLIARITGIFHIAIGGVYGLASYQYLWGAGDLGLPMAAAILLATLLSAGIGLLIDVLIYQRITGLHGKRKHANKLVAEAGPFVASIGALIVLDSTSQLWFGASPLGGHPPKLGVIDILGARVANWDFVKLALSLAAVIAMALWLARTRSGRAASALGESAEGASVVGIDERSIRLIVFATTGALAGLGGAIAVISNPTVPGTGLTIVLYGALVTMILPDSKIFTWWLASLGLGILYSAASVTYNSGWAEIIVQSFLVISLIVGRILLPQWKRRRKLRSGVAAARSIEPRESVGAADADATHDDIQVEESVR